jgi:hypothetical protein
MSALGVRGAAEVKEGKMPKTIKISDIKGSGRLTVVNDPELASVSVDKSVQWASDDLKDWRVIFGPNAPVHPKVASPEADTLTLRGKRPEDLRHCKYVVVGLTRENVLKHEDPELIVDG